MSNALVSRLRKAVSTSQRLAPFGKKICEIDAAKDVFEEFNSLVQAQNPNDKTLVGATFKRLPINENKEMSHGMAHLIFEDGSMLPVNLRELED